ncbi:MAG TPA: hypothetical protein VGS07_21390 [Thermoanaerobaculia bacterium]|jgi:hypothetical protein|nr:hypothetical protein [Thermoanaerobaculia bacterium]
MAENQDPNMEIQALSDDDLESVSGGASDLTTNSGGACSTGVKQLE